MGWMYTHKAKGVSLKEFFTKEFSNTDILECATINRTFYAAARNKGDSHVFALVCLVNYCKAYYNFGYKPMDETVGPNEAQCPARILALLSPTDSQWANEWRAKCRANLVTKHKAVTLEHGMRIRFAKPVTFTNGDVLDTFEVVKQGRKVRFRHGYGMYRISRYHERDFAVVS